MTNAMPPDVPRNPFDNIPLTWLSRLVPDAERNDARALLSSVDALSRFVRNFKMDVKLFDIASTEQCRLMVGGPPDITLRKTSGENLDIYSAWAHIAARDGAIQIYHLGAVMRSIKSALYSSPTLDKLIDKPKTRDATKLLERYFPNYELIRNAVAHSFFEVAPNVRLREKHTVDHIDIPEFISHGKNVAIADIINGRNFIVTFKKKVASYEISDASHAKLESVLNHFLEAFDQAATVYKYSRGQVRS
jgi:hypothetical protein